MSARVGNPEATLQFLGTGTSMGVPTLGCDCAVCISLDPRDRRMRPSVLVRWTEKDPGGAAQKRTVLIDTGPDFREQALAAGVRELDAVLYTHSHADHILGLDDLRPLSFQHMESTGEPIPLYASAETRAVMEHVFSYTFSQESTYSHRARVELREIGDGVTVGRLRFEPVPVMHGEMEIVGWRFGRAAYLTDISAIPESSFRQLAGLDVLVLSALRHKPHPSHATVAQAVAWAERIGARRTWLTHISHDLGHEETDRSLPDGIALAWDGLSVEFEAAVSGRTE
jgi:phosphoribosyl 1,2-cyclic phosphate phosphodiesterase